MKTLISKVTSFLTLSLIISACSTQTSITSSWRKPNATATRYRNVFVAALTSNIAAKQAVENGIQEQLQQKGLTVEKSMDIFPPNFSTDPAQRKDLVMSRIQSTGADAILTITLLKKETESRWVPGAGGYWNPGLRYGYYHSFWNYYSNWYPSVYAPGYYDQTKVYYLETNLFDAKSEQLVWAAQSQTYDPTSINGFLKGYLKAIHQQMVKDGLLVDNTTTASR